MQDTRNESYIDADRLAEDFLIVNCIWDPVGKLCQDGDTVHPALERYLSRDAFEQSDFTLRYWRDTFYKWDAGRYFPVSDSDMKCWIKSFLHNVNQTANPYGNYADRCVNITAARIANILLCLAGTQDVHIPERRSLNNWVDGSRAKYAQTIAFNNGLLVTDDRGQEPALIEHTPKYFTLTKLPYDYDPDADCPRWREFLLDVMGGDVERIELLCQWAGYLLMPTTEQQKFLLIAGEGQNGKTVFTSILERMVGLDNVSHIPLSQFSSQFALVSTLGKVLNSTSESSHRLDQFAETTLKSYTSGDRMTFQQKYKEPVHDVPTAKIMISTNQLPQFSDKSNGIWRRLLYVPFEKSYPEHLQNPHLVNELSAELGGILNWAFKGLQSLRQTGRFKIPQKCRKAVEQYRRDVNPARAFLLDNYVADFDYGCLPTQEVYACYVTWCQNNGYRSLNSNNFGKEVKRALPGVMRERKRIAGRVISFYSGIALKEEPEVTHNFGNVQSEFVQNLL